MKPRLHNLEPIPDGKTLGEVAPAFADVTEEVHFGPGNAHCAGCRRPFNESRKPRAAIRIYPTKTPLPIVFSYDLCRTCARSIRRGGSEGEGVLAGVDNCHSGVSAKDGQ